MRRSVTPGRIAGFEGRDAAARLGRFEIDQLAAHRSDDLLRIKANRLGIGAGKTHRIGPRR